MNRPPQVTPEKALEVICDIKAGDAPKASLKENQAARIMTGAIIPKGSDSVIMVEDTLRIASKEKFTRILKDRSEWKAFNGKISGGFLTPEIYRNSLYYQYVTCSNLSYQLPRNCLQ